MLYYVILCYIMLYYIMLYYSMLYYGENQTGKNDYRNLIKMNNTRIRSKKDNSQSFFYIDIAIQLTYVIEININ
jgi:hypothetical protein